MKLNILGIYLANIVLIILFKTSEMCQIDGEECLCVDLDLDVQKMDCFKKEQKYQILNLGKLNLTLMKKTKLSIQNKNISTIESSKNNENMQFLIVLNVTNCLVKRIEANTFQGMKNLSKIYLNGNLIEYINNDSFNLLTSLATLWLNSNKLTRIQNSLFKNLRFNMMYSSIFLS